MSESDVQFPQRGISPLDRGRPAVRLGRRLALACITLLTATAAARSQEGLALDQSPSANDPIQINANDIRYWDVDGVRWLLLEGDVSVLQGDADGIRAKRAIVRDAPELIAGSGGRRLDIYAEEDVRLTDRIGGGSSPSERLTLRSPFAVRLSPYRRGGLVRLKGPPDVASMEMARRGFPQAFPSPAKKENRSVSTKDSTRASTVAGAPARSSEPVRSAKTFPPTKPASPIGLKDRSFFDSLRRKSRKGSPSAPKTKPDHLDQTRISPNRVVPLSEEPDAKLKRNESPQSDFRFRRTSAEQIPANADPSAMRGEEEAPKGDPLDRGSQPNENVDRPGQTDPLPEIFPEDADRPPPEEFQAPVAPGSQQRIDIYPAGPNFAIKRLPRAANGTITYLITGGANLIANDQQAPGLTPEPKTAAEKRRAEAERKRREKEGEDGTTRGTIDIVADKFVIWTTEKNGDGSTLSANAEGGQSIAVDDNGSFEIYMEGNIVFRQDERLVQGNGDQRTFRAPRAYYDVKRKRFYGLDAELEQFLPGLIAPFRTKAPEILQFSPLVRNSQGKLVPGLSETRLERPESTGSRFPVPGYHFNSRTMDLTQIVSTNNGPNPRTGEQSVTTQIDARQNFFYIGPVPVFYWPRFIADADDPTPPLRNFEFLYGNYFGASLLSDFDGFKLFGLKRPQGSREFNVENWNVDIDELTMRGPALGSEFGYFGRALLPYSKGDYKGYLDLWGIIDNGVDVLGSGPAVITNGPPGAGKAGYQRFQTPPYQQLRGRFNFRHMQAVLDPDSADDDEDFVYQLDASYLSDRHFLEEYYKRLFDIGLDQDNLAYAIKQRRNQALTVQTEVNLQNFYTQTQWLPKIAYTRLGDALWGNRLTYSSNSGGDYAVTHTAIEVNNPNIFAFIPYDPVSNTSGTLRTARAWTSQELDLPLNFDLFRIVPYVQGQVIGWNNQIGYQPLGRVWGAAGARLNAMAWRRFPRVSSELLNVHGLNHKINFDVDARFAYSNLPLNRIGIQDKLDDNTYEFVRRYFALTNFAGGLLPKQYDPRFLTLRRAIDPITGTTDIQSSIDTIRFDIHQRLQTRRGPEGRRRTVDYMILDLTSTYYPNADRDNFGKPFGQNMYNYEWYVGDRTSIISYGWLEFFTITGRTLVSQGNPVRSNDPFSFKVNTTGISMSRPPRANLFIGYSIINTGPINTAALNLNYSYQLSPKWYSTYGTSYDFGNKILLGSFFSVTRIGADFLTSIGINIDPQRNNTTFGLEITPRLSPNIHIGSASAAGRFDPRYAATQ